MLSIRGSAIARLSLGIFWLEENLKTRRFPADFPLKVKQTSARLPMVTMGHLCPLTVLHIKWTYILISPITKVIYKLYIYIMN